MKEHINSIVWQVDNLEKLLAKIENDSKWVLSIIFDMQNNYTKYLDQINKVDKKRNKIRICALKLEQKLYISNKKRE